MVDIRISSVDGYQGEENEIILLSLVRSNTNNNVGYLCTVNRACVALTRARKGLYVTGDLDLLARNSDFWKGIKDYLCKLNAIGKSLEFYYIKNYSVYELLINILLILIGPKLLLKCQNHHNTILGEVSNHLHFNNLNLCKLKCNTTLPCGHSCDMDCHIDVSGHLEVKCLKTCEM